MKSQDWVPVSLPVRPAPGQAFFYATRNNKAMVCSNRPLDDWFINKYGVTHWQPVVLPGDPPAAFTPGAVVARKHDGGFMEVLHVTPDLCNPALKWVLCGYRNKANEYWKSEYRSDTLRLLVPGTDK